MLLLHILIALTSVGFSSYLFFAPSKTGLHISYGLVGATLASGTFLVWSTHANVLQACLTGLVYVGGISLAIVSVRQKLASQKTRN